MGNCIRRQKASRVNDNDDDWGSLLSIYREREGDNGGGTSTVEKEMLLSRKRDTNTSTREMKITISKKELEVLAQQVEMQGLTLRQVLANMVNGDDGEEQPRPWKPELQSIPEVN
ncbi:F11F12.2-like protein [Hibiscus syriacus]|uniref:F11F12.2-like protein n=1 Tax=Hibiscus syriacus TaxID=106335 RepID=A0A6A2ZDU1_HIBSY|nr:uncharacterized protein LOC120146859 [Hibiscus syriacus]KAE8689827.1 F11F12.2-like protein [Hibiscus syriacus]